MNNEKELETTIHKFNVDFYEFLYTKKVFKLLPSCGWLDGGCRSLMKALILWLGEENLTTYQIVRNKNDIHSDHALIKIQDCYIDAEGISTYSQLFNRWKECEYHGKYTPIIRPYDFVDEPLDKTGEAPFYISDKNILKLKELIEEEFNKDEILSLIKKVWE